MTLTNAKINNQINLVNLVLVSTASTGQHKLINYEQEALAPCLGYPVEDRSPPRRTSQI
jgi:hypothetical protein